MGETRYQQLCQASQHSAFWKSGQVKELALQHTHHIVAAEPAEISFWAGTDTNNNDLKQSAALQEQSVLSLSSTDLELQALTGSMATRTELPRPDPGPCGMGCWQGHGFELVQPGDEKGSQGGRDIRRGTVKEQETYGLWSMTGMGILALPLLVG